MENYIDRSKLKSGGKGDAIGLINDVVQVLPISETGKQISQTVADAVPARLGYDAAKCLLKDNKGQCVRDARNDVIKSGSRPLAGYALAWGVVDHWNDPRKLNELYEMQKNTITGKIAEAIVSDDLEVSFFVLSVNCFDVIPKGQHASSPVFMRIFA